MNKLKTAPDQQQRDIALNPQGSFVVRAPAGSGKTSLLVSRYLTLLSTVNQPEEILAITFTRKAAAEMRSRISSSLSHGQDRLSQKARSANQAKKWNILENPNRLKIQTIDSFNATLASSLPLQSELSPNLQLSDDSEFLYQEAVERLFRHINKPLNSGKDFQAELLADMLAMLGNDYAKASRLIISMLAKRDQWLEHTALILKEVLSAEDNQNLVVNRVFKQALSSLNQKVISAFLNTLTETQSNELAVLFEYSQASLGTDDITGLSIQQGATAHPDENPNSRSETTFAESPEIWRKVGELLTTATGSLRKTVNKNQGFPAGAGKNKEMKERMLSFLSSLANGHHGLKNLRLIPDANFSALEAQNLFTLCAGLSLAALELQQVFNDEGATDYTQMAIAALQALGDSDHATDLALALDYRINHLLIDEYQDTSWIQNALVLRLTREWQNDQGRSFFAVGDPMQSIYRFRDADVSLFIRSTDMQFGTIQPRAITLSANFRSSPKLVDWFNTVFAYSFGENADPNLGQIPYQSADAARADLLNKTNSAITLDLFSGTNGKVLEAKYIAKNISQLQEKNAQASIAILVRSRAHTKCIVHELDAAKVHWQGTEIDSLQEEPAVMDLLTLVKLLWQPDDIVSSLALLRSPMLGLQLEDLLKLAVFLRSRSAQGKTPLTALLELKDTGCGETLNNLNLSQFAANALARCLPCLSLASQQVGGVLPRQILEQLWIRLGCVDIYVDSRAQKAVSKLLLLIEKQAQSSSLYSLDLRNLEQQLTKLYIENTPVPGAVQLMTIHKAKGLQFDHVFLPALAHRTKSRNRELLRWRLHEGALLMASSLNNASGSLYKWLDTEDAEREQNETRRLLYVATTRACLSLHLSGVLDADSSPVKSSLLGPIWDCVKEDANWHEDAPVAPPLIQKQSIQYSRLPASYQWQNPTHCDDDLFLGKRSESVDPEPPHAVQNSAEIILGLVVHEIMCELSKNLPDSTPEGISTYISEKRNTWRSMLQSNLVNYPHTNAQENSLLDPEISQYVDLDSLLTTIEQQIKGVLRDPDGIWLLSTERHEPFSEKAFTGIYNKNLVNVIIDRTFVDEDNIRWLIDYKSAQIPEHMSKAQFVEQQAHWHLPQLQKYATLLTAWKPHKVRKAIYFTSLPLLKVIDDDC